MLSGDDPKAVHNALFTLVYHFQQTFVSPMFAQIIIGTNVLPNVFWQMFAVYIEACLKPPCKQLIIYL